MDVIFPSKRACAREPPRARPGTRPQPIEQRISIGKLTNPALFRDHRAGQAQAGGALQLLDPVRDVVQVDHRDALQSDGIRAAELGEPVVVRAKDGGHQQIPSFGHDNRADEAEG